MKKFNLELAKKGHPVCTRDGRNVRIICWDRKSKLSEFPIVALVESNGIEFIFRYTNEGFSSKGHIRNHDLVMKTLKHEGWVNVYSNQFIAGMYNTGKIVYECEKDAISSVATESMDYITTIKIEWEE